MFQKITLIVLVILQGSVLTTFAQSDAEARLEGMVTDRLGSLVVGAKVVVEDSVSNKQYSASTNESGKYRFLFPAGIYKISVTEYGFCPQSRANFRLERGTEITINISLIDCDTETVIEIGPDKSQSGILAQYKIPYKQESLLIGGGLTKEAQIQFGSKRVVNNLTTYAAITLTSNQSIPVRFTYELIQITASKIVVKRGNLFTAKGSVVLEDGKDRQEFSFLDFSLEGGTLRIISSRRCT